MRGRCHPVSSRPFPSVLRFRVCHRPAPELASKAQKPSPSDRVAIYDPWLSEAERGGFEPPVPLARHNGFRGLWPISGEQCLVCIDTVLCGWNTALTVSCPSRCGEFATRMAPKAGADLGCGPWRSPHAATESRDARRGMSSVRVPRLRKSRTCHWAHPVDRLMSYHT